MKYCENCEDWVETDNGRCIYCNRVIENEKEKSNFELEDEEIEEEIDYL